MMRLNRKIPTTILDEEGVPVDWNSISLLHRNLLRKYKPEQLDTKGVLFRADPADEMLEDILGRNSGLGWHFRRRYRDHTHGRGSYIDGSVKRT